MPYKPRSKPHFGGPHALRKKREKKWLAEEARRKKAYEEAEAAKQNSATNDTEPHDTEPHDTEPHDTEPNKTMANEDAA